MQAIGFNEHYSLQTAVFERRKTKTRRLELLSLLEGLTEDDFWFGIVDGKKQVQLYDDNPGPEIIMPRYNIGEDGTKRNKKTNGCMIDGKVYQEWPKSMRNTKQPV